MLLVIRLFQAGYEALATKVLALRVLLGWTAHMPLACNAYPKICHETDPRGTAIVHALPFVHPLAATGLGRKRRAHPFKNKNRKRKGWAPSTGKNKLKIDSARQGSHSCLGRLRNQV